jgi:hypothetical protein
MAKLLPIFPKTKIIIWQGQLLFKQRFDSSAYRQSKICRSNFVIFQRLGMLMVIRNKDNDPKKFS